jgi:hypothetical protein
MLDRRELVRLYRPLLDARDALVNYLAGKDAAVEVPARPVKGVEPLPFCLRDGWLGDELRIEGLPLCVVREPNLPCPRPRTAERIPELDVVDLLTLPVIEDDRVARIECRQDSRRPQNP